MEPGVGVVAAEDQACAVFPEDALGHGGEDELQHGLLAVEFLAEFNLLKVDGFEFEILTMHLPASAVEVFEHAPQGEIEDRAAQQHDQHDGRRDAVAEQLKTVAIAFDLQRQGLDFLPGPSVEGVEVVLKFVQCGDMTFQIESMWTHKIRRRRQRCDCRIVLKGPTQISSAAEGEDLLAMPGGGLAQPVELGIQVTERAGQLAVGLPATVEFLAVMKNLHGGGDGGVEGVGGWAWASLPTWWFSASRRTAVLVRCSWWTTPCTWPRLWVMHWTRT